MGETVEELRGERNDLLVAVERWTPELQREVRSTLWHGVLTKAANQTDRMLELTVMIAVARAGESGAAILQRIASGKTPDRLTMGQRLDALKSLDRQRLITPGARVLGKADRDLLEDLTGLRNDFLHGRLPSGQGSVETLRFLEYARQLCTGNFIRRLVGDV